MIFSVNYDINFDMKSANESVPWAAAIGPKHVIELTDAALSADYTRVRRVASLIARGLAAAGEETAARTLRALVRKRGVPLRASGYVESLPVDAKSRLPLVEEQQWPDTPLFLTSQDSHSLRDFLSDVRHIDKLSAKGLASRLSLLVIGPPGTGKTLLAGHIASQLSRSFYVARLDSVISSLLGDTAKNIRRVFDFAPSRGGVLLLDELDAVAKLRDDRHELGELKRVVNTVIQGLDSLDSHAVVVAATNHPHLLDPAIWRRFPYKIRLGNPDVGVRRELWEYFLFENRATDKSPMLLANISEGLSGADIEAISLAARRHALIQSRSVDLAAVTRAVLSSLGDDSVLPRREPLDTAEKRDLTRKLDGHCGLGRADIARLIGVARQTVYHYLR